MSAAGAELLRLAEQMLRQRGCVRCASEPALSVRGAGLLGRAVLTVLAARELLVPRVTSATVLGSGPSATVQCAVLVAGLSGLDSVVVHPGHPDPGLSRMAGEAGVSVSACADVGRAVFGADLVVLATQPGHPPDPVWHGRLLPGAVVVNASGAPSPGLLVRAADRVFADAPTRVLGQPPDREPIGIAQVLRGERRGRTAVDELLLVELAGSPRLEEALALRLTEIQRAGVAEGVRVRTGGAGRLRASASCVGGGGEGPPGCPGG